MSRRRKYRRITPELRREVMQLAAKGLSYRQILARVDTSRGAVGIMLRPLGGVAPRDMLEPTGKRLSLEERSKSVSAWTEAGLCAVSAPGWAARRRRSVGK